MTAIKIRNILLEAYSNFPILDFPIPIVIPYPFHFTILSKLMEKMMKTRLFPSSASPLTTTGAITCV